MGNCKACRHWDLEGDAYDHYDNHGEDVSGHARICLKVVHSGQSEPDALAYVTDASGYKANLWCDPTFGCALFEAKEPAA